MLTNCAQTCILLRNMCCATIYAKRNLLNSKSSQCGYTDLLACSEFLVEDMCKTIDSLPTHICFLVENASHPPSTTYRHKSTLK